MIRTKTYIDTAHDLEKFQAYRTFSGLNEAYDNMNHCLLHYLCQYHGLPIKMLGNRFPLDAYRDAMDSKMVLCIPDFRAQDMEDREAFNDSLYVYPTKDMALHDQPNGRVITIQEFDRQIIGMGWETLQDRGRRLAAFKKCAEKLDIRMPTIYRAVCFTPTLKPEHDYSYRNLAFIIAGVSPHLCWGPTGRPLEDQAYDSTTYLRERGSSRSGWISEDAVTRSLDRLGRNGIPV